MEEFLLQRAKETMERWMQTTGVYDSDGKQVA